MSDLKIIERVLETQAARSIIVDWYDGVVKAVTEYPYMGCWLYSFLVAVDTNNQNKIYGFCVIDGKEYEQLSCLLEEQEMISSSLGHLSQSCFDEVSLFLLNKVDRSEHIFLTRTKDVLRDTGSKLLLANEAPVLDYEQIIDLDSEHVQKLFEMFD